MCMEAMKKEKRRKGMGTKNEKGKNGGKGHAHNDDAVVLK